MTTPKNPLSPLLNVTWSALDAVAWVLRSPVTGLMWLLDHTPTITVSFPEKK